MASRSRTTRGQGSLFADETSSTPPPGFEFPAAWAGLLSAECAKPYFAELLRFVTEERQLGMVFPAEAQQFEAFRLTPPEAVRVVLLGQDPYPTPGHAHGLAFSVEPGVAPPASLRNMFKELQSDLGIPPSTSGDLRPWAKQGVLLLNTVLTVRSGEPGSHAKHGWETFTDACLEAINRFAQPVVFLLWGNSAIKKRPLIDETNHVVLTSAHPSPLSASKGFFGSRPFSQANEDLTRLGREPIHWQLPG